MQINKITKLKCLGVFKDFKWDQNIPHFRKHNLFYGWNYSGKTTISRAFRCFELGEKHADYPNSEFELEDNQNPSKKYTDKDLSTLPHIRVFNTDFILKNLKWYSQDDDGNGILKMMTVLSRFSFLLAKKILNCRNSWKN